MSGRIIRSRSASRRQKGNPAGSKGWALPAQPAPAPQSGSRQFGLYGHSAALSGSVGFGPGEPIPGTGGIIPPDGRPRAWSYPVGSNIATMPGSGEDVSFESLRNLASLYDGIQLCERVYFDLLGRLELRVQPRTELLADGVDARSPQWREGAHVIESLLESPDRAQDLRTWMIALVRDILEIDAVGVYRARDLRGRLWGLELVAGETIKPLIEEHGRIPEPPDPAYQQVVYGAPAGWYTRDEMDYLRETGRTESIYGFSRVRRIVLRVNQALRKQDFDLARFTDGVTPLGFISTPESLMWTPEQMEQFERSFNGMLAGNDQMRVRARALPPGSSWQSLAGDDPMVAFDRFLLNVTVAAFGLTMDELGFTETSNRSVGDSQEAVIYRRAVAPMVGIIGGYLTRVVREEIDDRYTVSFGGFEEPEDFASRAEALAKLIPTGAISPSDAARLLRLPVEREVPAYILTRFGPVLVDDVIAGRGLSPQQVNEIKHEVGRPPRDELGEAEGSDPL